MSDETTGEGADDEPDTGNDGPNEEEQPFWPPPRQPTPPPAFDGGDGSNGKERGPEPPNWVEKGTFIVLILAFIAAGVGAYEADRLARDTEKALIDARVSGQIAHDDNVRSERLTAVALKQAETNAALAHADNVNALDAAHSSYKLAQSTARGQERLTRQSNSINESAFKKQNTITQGQLAEMQADRRPWISVAVGVESVSWDATGAKVVIAYEFKNTGHSPAMHVSFQDDLVAWMFPDPKRMPIGWIENAFKGVPKQGVPTHYGFPIFPGEAKPFLVERTFTRADIEKLKSWFRTFKHDASEPDRPPIPDSELLLPLDIVYLVDYETDVPGTHHQTYCWAKFGTVPPGYGGIVLPIGVNLTAGQIRMSYGILDCGAN